MSGRHLVSVALPVAVGRPYTYAFDRPIEPGAIVSAPLGPREMIGVVWPAPAEPIDAAKIRALSRVYETPPLPPSLLAFIEWVADYTLTPVGSVLRMVLRVPAALEPEPPLMGLRLSGEPPPRMTDARRRVLEAAADGLARPRAVLAAEAGVSPGVVDGLTQAGALQAVALPRRAPPAEPDPNHGTIALSPAQREAADALAALVRTGGHSAVLLDGVTGAGKTEVYFEAVAEALRSGRQALVLLPEIALTGAFLERFARRFGAPPAEWHSQLGPRQRERTWRAVAGGEAKVVVGARSALFLPFANLGLIVVDEEHDPAYKQEDGVTYHARDMAIVRGHLAGFPVVLATATPSVETWVNAERGRYRRLVLPARHGEARPPDIGALDLRRDPPERGRWLAPTLVGAIASAVEAGGQALLFLNRRGFAPLTLCRACGHRLACPNCSAWLVDHRFRGVLACHHCGHETRRPQSCPGCGEADTLVPCGPGVERLQEEVLSRFPALRTLVLSSDLAGGVERLRLELAAVAKGEVDIVIGTQLVAKGHNFPRLTFVGVVDADLGLSYGDPRAAERTFQMLTQVAGRAGRAGGPSRALLQTYEPDHPVLRALVKGDRDAFYAEEAASRRRGRLPPFGRLAGVVVSANDRAAALAHARAMARAAPLSDAARLFGPAEAPLALVRGRYRFRLLVQGQAAGALNSWLKEWLLAAPKPRGNVRVDVDVDAQSFL